MTRETFYYLIKVQYLGFRYHGWQRQPGVRTVQEMVERTFSFIFEHDRFKILAAGRTDARVSAEDAAFELFTYQPVDTEWLLRAMNQNLPPDIRLLEATEVDSTFNIIQTAKQKEYIYLFSYGERNHPFCAPFMIYMEEVLDIPRMKQAARMFEGWHDFRLFCKKPSEETLTEREVILSEIAENDLYTASFFPAQSFIFRVRGPGFLRHQVRLMMGALFAIGKGELSQEALAQALLGTGDGPVARMAPQSGLILKKIQFT